MLITDGARVDPKLGCADVNGIRRFWQGVRHALVISSNKYTGRSNHSRSEILTVECRANTLIM